MQFKSGVVWTSDVHPSLWFARAVLDSVSEKVAGRQAIVTSVEDGTHSKTSLHYEGRAIDLRTRDLEAGVIHDYASELRGALGPGWDVIVESTHIHIEWDRRNDVAVGE